MEEDNYGEYVRFDNHEAEIARLRAEVEALRDLLADMIDLCEFWIDRGREPNMSEERYMLWLHLGRHSAAMQKARAALAKAGG